MCVFCVCFCVCICMRVCVCVCVCEQAHPLHASLTSLSVLTGAVPSSSGAVMETMTARTTLMR